MNELALFSGAGGGILGGKLLGWRTVCAVEIDEHCRDVLVARQNDGCLDHPFPIWSDIRSFRSDNPATAGMFEALRKVPDLVITGGFPCTDISSAGRGTGIEGEQSGLWKHFARVVSEVHPRWVFIENSPMLAVGRGLGTVLCDLAEMGFDAEWGVVGAHHLKAPHKRDRIWILGHPHGNGKPVESFNDKQAPRLPELAPAHPSVTRTDDGWICGECGMGIFDGCSHYHGEWQCNDCKEWTYPFYYGIEEGCQHCASTDVAYPLCGTGPLHRNDTRMGRLKELGKKGAARVGPWEIEPAMGRVVDGLADEFHVPGSGPAEGLGQLGKDIPNRSARLRSIGNGQVPACAALAWQILYKRLNQPSPKKEL